MIKAVIFDLDDTLISEKQYIESGYRYIANLLDSRINISSDIIYAGLIELFNHSSKDVFNRFYVEYGIEYSNEMIINLVNEYRSHYPNIKFFDDVIPCLHELKDRGIKTGIITDGYAVAQRRKLIAVEADKYFDEIIVTDELGRDYWKPHPRAFDIMKDKLNVEFSKMIYVGDNPEKDFYISSAYPIKTVRILRNGIHKNKSYLNGIREHFNINNLGDVTKIIGGEYEDFTTF